MTIPTANGKAGGNSTCQKTDRVRT